MENDFLAGNNVQATRMKEEKWFKHMEFSIWMRFFLDFVSNTMKIHIYIYGNDIKR